MSRDLHACNSLNQSWNSNPTVEASRVAEGMEEEFLGGSVVDGMPIEPRATLLLRELGQNSGTNIIPSLKLRMQEDKSKGSQVFLCSFVQHYGSQPGYDKGWGCGWRNIQIMSSFLLHRDQKAREALFFGSCVMPEIEELQGYLEMAWRHGFDPDGAQQLGGSVKGTNKWIGTTECAALLRQFGFRAQIVDFRLTNRDSNCLSEWVWRYFAADSKDCNENRVNVCHKSPLYFQRDGHSCTIIGVEKRLGSTDSEDDINLFILDPLISIEDLERALSERNAWQSKILRSGKSIAKAEYQLLWVQNGIAEGREKEQLKLIAAIERHGL